MNVVLELDSVPDSAFGMVIGINGENLKRLKQAHRVRIWIPPPSQPGQVVISGPRAACEACRADIMQMLDARSRGPSRATVKGKGRGRGGAGSAEAQSRSPSRATAKGEGRGRGGTGSAEAAQKLFPPMCGLCDSHMSSLDQMFEHLGRKTHMEKLIKASLPDLPTGSGDECPCGRLSIEEVAERFKNDRFAEVHVAFGFKACDVLEAAPLAIDRREAVAELARSIQDFPPDGEWLRVCDRWTLRWNDTLADSATTSYLTQAPPLEDMVRRITLDSRPPLARIIMNALPMALPGIDCSKRKQNRLKADHKYPADPGSCRLGFAFLQMRGLLSGGASPFDVVCGTSFIKALTGDTKSCNENFYMARYRDMAIVLHEPSGRHGQNDAGHAVERLLCGKPKGTYSAVSSLVIQQKRLLVVSEIDASDAHHNIVELKSSTINKGEAIVSDKIALQVLINGSAFVLACGLDKDGCKLESIECISSRSLQERFQERLQAVGQRCSCLLERTLSMFNAVAAGGDVGDVWKLTFDGRLGNAPVLEAAHEDIQVLPVGSHEA